jgi:hypothetical protein
MTGKPTRPAEVTALVDDVPIIYVRRDLVRTVRH